MEREPGHRRGHDLIERRVHVADHDTVGEHRDHPGNKQADADSLRIDNGHAVRPIPVITSATANPTSASGSYLLDVQGDGFLAGAALMVAGTQMPTTHVSATELQTTVTSSGTQITVSVKNPYPGAVYSVTSHVPLGTMQASATAAARLLDQSTFGPTETSIRHVQQMGLQGFLNEQFNTPPTYLPACRRPPLRNARLRRSRQCACARTGSRTR